MNTVAYFTICSRQIQEFLTYLPQIFWQKKNVRFQRSSLGEVKCNAFHILLHPANLARSGQEYFLKKRGTFCEKTIAIHLVGSVYGVEIATRNRLGREGSKR